MTTHALPNPLTLLVADAHRFGPGKVHVFFPDTNRTRCGKTRIAIPGRIQGGVLADVTCRGCLISLERDRQRSVEQRQRDEAQREWREWYEAYLTTGAWRRRREKVLRRAGGRCEGCDERSAVQVHHTTYEHVGDEFLFELRALCAECHKRLHGKAA